MSELDRFLDRLVEILEHRDVGALHRPIPIRDLRSTVIPYRFNRSVLALSSSEDYELLVLQLIAETDGYTQVVPADAAAQARAELASPNPDLDLIETLGAATILLTASGIGRVMSIRNERRAGAAAHPPRAEPAPADAAGSAAAPDAAEPDAGLAETAEPEPMPLPEPEPVPEFEPLADSVTVDSLSEDGEPAAPAAETPAPRCTACDGALPTHRPVAFCPFCGAQVGTARCRRCDSEIDPGWKHCVSCGQAVAGG